MPVQRNHTPPSVIKNCVIAYNESFRPMIFTNDTLMTIANYDDLSERIATLIAEQIKQKPNSCLGLPTGHTPMGTYKVLSKWSREGRLDWSNVHCFALDDYIDVQEELSFHYFLESNLYVNTNIKAENKHHPTQCDNYDALIESLGGLDLTVLGIGGNGHIAFNEPGTAAMSWTHCTWLAQSTRIANQGFFGRLEAVPDRGVTMGVSTILNSRKIILVASGEKKRAIVEESFKGKVTRDVPASLLQCHRAVSVLTDFGFNQAATY